MIDYILRTKMGEQNNVFGCEVRRLRKLYNWSQSDLATLSGISLGLISLIERGRHNNPSVLTVLNLDRALKARGKLKRLIFESMN